jgi:hypothetical protein
MTMDYTQALHATTSLIIPAAVHQLSAWQIQAVLYVADPATGRFPLTTGLIEICVYEPPDFTISLTFARPVTGYLYVHEDPAMRYMYTANRYRADFMDPQGFR